ncbi:MAG TPA: gliding motility-associated C-terminal domain-containing protein, partial [Flavobacteriaceae bacterium]|nr:gliding motility-associated C-terminal domain-containing protein [Flavobacteriaceae bacterium]
TDAGNNENMYFEPYFPGSYDTYLGDWECYVIDEDDPSSYTVSTERFYGYENTDYEWYKMDEETGEYGEIISTEENISIHPDDFGPGTYKVVVTYHERPDNACVVFGEVTVPAEFDVSLPNANPYVCEEDENTLEDVVVDEENIKWYATEDSEEELPLSTAIQDGETYWVTHQLGNCESERLAVTITMVDCSLNGELTVTKTVTNGDEPDSFSDVGDVVEYEITVTNIGQSPVFDIEITDENADETAVGTIDELGVGESQTFIATHTITQDDIDAGFVSNLAIAQGLSEYDHTIEAESEDNDPLPDIPTDPDCEHCTIAPVRQGPTAVDDNRNTYPGVEITIAVLDNDEEGNSAIIPEEVRLIDLDNGQEVEVVTITGEGTFTTQEDGTVDFESENDFSGTVTPVDYIIYDENNLSDQATIYVEVNALTQPEVAFEYSSEIYCKLDENPTPILPDDFTEDGVFTAIPNGLAIDSSSGNIDLAESDAGIYEVTYTIEEDLEEGIAGAEHTVEIEIIEAWFPEVEFDYDGVTFCALEEDLVPNLSDSFSEDGVFSASPSGLAIEETTGIVDLTNSDPGVYEITYAVEQDMDECRAAGEFTVEIEIIGALIPEVEFDYGGIAFCVLEEELTPNLPNSFSEDGVFNASSSGLVIDEITGIIDLTNSEPGVYEITYIVEQDMAECRASGEFTVEIEIEEVTEPNLGFNYSEEFYCIGMENPIPQLGDDFAEGGVFSASPEGLEISASSGVIYLFLSEPGFYEVTYSIEESMEECHSAGEKTVSIEIIESTEPVVQFHYDHQEYCPGDENPIPNKADGFIDGGEFVASPGGLSIDDYSGEINLSSSMAGDYQVTYTVEEDKDICLHAGQYTVNVSIAEDISFYLESYCENNRLMIKPNFGNQTPIGVDYLWKDEVGTVIWEGEIIDLQEALGSTPLPIQISLFLETDNCVWSESTLVERTFCDLPEGFSPNEDGINDSFDLSFMDVMVFKVFSRYGNVVYEKLNYIDEWQGQDKNGNLLPDFTYYYVIKTRNGQVTKGWVYLNK